MFKNVPFANNDHLLPVKADPASFDSEAEAEMHESYNSVVYTMKQAVRVLSEFIEDHHSKCFGLTDSGLLHVSVESVSKDGTVSWEDDYIKPSLSAVRNWLGY